MDFHVTDPIRGPNAVRIENAGRRSKGVECERNEESEDPFSPEMTASDM